MKKDKTEIVIVLDRSGSMASIKKDIEGGFKTFLDKQKTLAGEAFITLYQFDTQYEKVYEAKNIQEINEIKIVPRGGTALIDALGRAIAETGERFNKTLESERAESVIVLVLSDGEENSSREFTMEKLKESVKHQESIYNWKFIFLGCNFDAIKAGAGYGLSRGSTLNFVATAAGIDASFNAVGNATSFYRSSTSKSASYDFSDAERGAALDEKK